MSRPSQRIDSAEMREFGGGEVSARSDTAPNFTSGCVSTTTALGRSGRESAPSLSTGCNNTMHVSSKNRALMVTTRKGLTRHKISDREPTVATEAVNGWMASTQNETRSLARGSLHRL